VGAPTDARGMNAKRPFVQRVRRTFGRFLENIQVTIAIGGLAILVLVQIPWLDTPLTKLGFSDFSGLSQTVVVAVLVGLSLEIRSLNQRASAAMLKQTHFSDPMDVYPALIDRARTISRADEKTLDVLGISLYTAWPSIRFWLNRPGEMTGWSVRLTAVVDADSLSRWVPPDWFSEAKANLDSIVHEANSPSIRSRGISLRAYGYDFVPALHGYRLGNGDLYYSLLKWEKDGTIGRHGYSYEFVPCTDHSPSAQTIREVFDSWLARAQLREWP
jgi:hypothetical protein